VVVVAVVRFHCRSSVLPEVDDVEVVVVVVAWSKTSWGTETVIVGDEAESSSSLLLLLLVVVVALLLAASGLLEGGARFLNIVR
jgi:hypothetical protein